MRRDGVTMKHELKLISLTLKHANHLVQQWHRHHKPVASHRFSIGVEKNGVLVGAAIVGRPVSRQIDQHHVVEITRLVTNGQRNACSFLYSACARIAKARWFSKIQTYISEHEPGTSLKTSTDQV